MLPGLPALPLVLLPANIKPKGQYFKSPEPYLDLLSCGRFTSRLAFLVGDVLARVYYLLDLKYSVPNRCPRFQPRWRMLEFEHHGGDLGEEASASKETQGRGWSTIPFQGGAVTAGG